MAAEISGPIPSPSIRVTHWGHWENINLAKILVQKIICALPVPLCCWLWPPNEAEYPLSFLPVKRALFPISSCCMSGSIVWYEGALLMEKKINIYNLASFLASSVLWWLLVAVSSCCSASERVRAISSSSLRFSSGGGREAVRRSNCR